MDDRRTKRGLRSRGAERSEDEKVRPGAAPPSGGGGIFKSAAVAVLRQHRKLMTTGDITRLAVEMGLLKCQGKTPEATMASALYTDVKRKLQKSLFTRPQEGLFGLREWLEEGYYPEGWVGPPDGLGLAPFKRRNNTGTAHPGSTPAPASAAKAGRQGVRTGPCRSSKSRAARSWRTASSDAEDDDILEDDDDDLVLTGGRSYAGSAAAAAHAGGALAGHGEDEDMDEALGEGEDADMEEEADGGDDTAEEGQEEQGSDRRAGNEEALGGATSDEQLHHHSKEGGSGRGYPPQPAASPGPSVGRRSGRMRSGGGAGGAAEAGLPQDECLSPLHMLGEAAASESVGDMAAEPHGAPPAKRKRPSSITVPDRGGGGGLGGVEGATPKSPYEDSLAALHEIATSPSTFDLTSHREAQQQQQQQQRDREAAARGGGLQVGEGSGGSGAGKVGRARPRLHVDVPAQGSDLAAGPGSRRDGGTPGTTLLTDNPLMQGETTPAILLQASPVTTANGQQAMMLRQAPVLVTLPPALASPSAASAGQLDTPALLHVQLPGGAPSELMQTTLITPSATPTGQQLTLFRPQAPGSGGTGLAGRGGLKADTGPASSRPVGRRVSFSGQVGILGPPAVPGAPLHQPLQPPGQAASGSAPCFPTGTAASGPIQGATPTRGQTWPPRLTAAQVEHELAEITRMQTVVERLESKLGNTHPQVGKAWLSVSRMYQHLAEAQRNNGEDCASSKAQCVEALKRARAVCRAVAESCGTTLQCEAAFEYLTARNNEPSAVDVEPAPVTGAGASPTDGARPGIGGGEWPAEQGRDPAATDVQGGSQGGAAPDSIPSGSAAATAADGGSEVQERQEQPPQQEQHRQDMGSAGADGLAGDAEMAGAPQTTDAVQG
ncbi:hypothetical protein PLESTB_001524600 [Pleodorina starrii]|uniref:HTH HARE-type domain-containing protein n=1 Tax=Pleodorina starrii TaxID=330485 RepID=A0A9W6BX45_9CHLO|nr:hypothetical protein PLESTM_001169100 [Pleodorina starrii]GLC59703.1 hypothetical protein PLESTB_001524600 [Pleodorina starrii]GLC75374.1 hypothetical protein PLESTF_001629200 [Pleodorina starrii]